MRRKSRTARHALAGPTPASTEDAINPVPGADLPTDPDSDVDLASELAGAASELGVASELGGAASELGVASELRGAATAEAEPLAGARHRLAGRRARRGAGTRARGRDPRAVALNILAASVLVGGAAFGATWMIHHRTKPASPHTTDAANISDRDAAAQRANRSQQRSPNASPSAVPSDSAAPSAEPPLATPTAAIPLAKQVDWVSPMPDVPMTSCYGMRWGVMHQGIDFAGDAGTAIHAVGAGTVITAGWAYSGYGISVVIDHGNGFFSHYAHASRVLVAVGDKVTPGQQIAVEGATGDVTGPHLHFEIHQGALWNQINPAVWLRAHGVTVGC